MPSKSLLTFADKALSHFYIRQLTQSIDSDPARGLGIDLLDFFRSIDRLFI